MVRQAYHDKYATTILDSGLSNLSPQLFPRLGKIRDPEEEFPGGKDDFSV
ncbi:MAG: hypothetical protein HOG73_13715 [Candidatus Marinimicrobia bacterium]|jgi:hypothetical protein|nr:hypothetical protein [Candidatus Neomarinimicrobiota bacterium]